MFDPLEKLVASSFLASNNETVNFKVTWLLNETVRNKLSSTDRLEMEVEVSGYLLKKVPL